MLKSITKKKTNQTLKQELVNFLKENGDVEQAGINEIANKTKDPIEAINIINQYE